MRGDRSKDPAVCGMPGDSRTVFIAYPQPASRSVGQRREKPVRPLLRGPLGGNERDAAARAVRVFKLRTSVSLQSFRGAITKARNTGPSQMADTVVRVV